MSRNQELHYLKSILRQLQEIKGTLDELTLGGEALADNVDWLDCYVDALERGEKRFVLHDGVDQTKTDELHMFLDGLEWEGDESGVSVVLRVGIGDTIVRHGDKVWVEEKS